MRPEHLWETKNAHAYLNAVLMGVFSISPKSKKYVGNYRFLGVDNHGDEVPCIHHVFVDLRNSERVEIYIPQDL